MGDKLTAPHTDVTVTRGSDKNFQDSTGRTLADYLRPSVAVDTALLTRDPRRGLVVLQVARDDAGKWALPGTFLHHGETLAQAVERSLERQSRCARNKTRASCTCSTPRPATIAAGCSRWPTWPW